MTIEHHPQQNLVTAYVAGRLDHGQHVAVATHLAACSACRATVRDVEQLGGNVLAQMAPTALSQDALARTLSRLDRPAPPPAAKPASASDIRGLPDFVRRYRFAPWQTVAPSLAVRRIELPEPGLTRVFLLKSRPGTRLLRHSHTGLEMTCVLSGGFEHDGGHFAPGDFDFADGRHIHEITIGNEGDCISLVAMQGDLRLHGLLGRLLQPFVRL